MHSSNARLASGLHPARITKQELEITFMRLYAYMCACLHFNRGISMTFINYGKYLLKLIMYQTLF